MGYQDNALFQSRKKIAEAINRGENCDAEIEQHCKQFDCDGDKKAAERNFIFSMAAQAPSVNLYVNKPAIEDVELLCAKDVKPEAINWLWKDWIAKRKLQLLAGTPGDGKSTSCFSFAATVSRGGKFPDGTEAKEGRVLIWSGEDGIADTIIPRLIAMNAKLENIFIVSTVTEKGEKRAFDPSTDLEALDRKLEKIEGGVELLILDPFINAVKKGKNSHNNAETRQGLQHVVDFAERNDCAVIGVHHLTKGTKGQEPIERVTGSIAIPALARIVLMTTTKKSEDNEGPQRILVRAKTNIGKPGGAYGYEIGFTILQEPPIEVSYIRWGQFVSGSAHELISEAEEVKGKKEKQLDKACEFLDELLKGGQKPATEIFARAEEAGHAEKTIKRAKKELNVNSTKTSEGWLWSLPGDEEAAM